MGKISAPERSGRPTSSIVDHPSQLHLVSQFLRQSLFLPPSGAVCWVESLLLKLNQFLRLNLSTLNRSLNLDGDNWRPPQREAE
jgi:hypothetical protein